MTVTSASTTDNAAAGAAEILMSCKGVTARYSRIQVVDGVDLELRAGEMLAILGPNGAGKSSMLGAIAGTVSGGGDINVRGRNISRLSAPARAARGVSLVPEQRGNIFPTMSVSENIEIGLRLLPQDRRDGQRDFIFELFPILKKRDDAAAGVLSGGEQQMLAIALAIGRDPDVLILDEPSQGLAPTVFDLLENTFSILTKKGISLLLAEQNVPFASRVADRYMVLSYGKVVRVGDKEDLRDPEDLADTFMGTADD